MKYRILERGGVFFPQHWKLFIGWSGAGNDDRIPSFKTLEEARKYVERLKNPTADVIHEVD